MTKDTNDTAHSPLIRQRAIGEQILLDKDGYYFCCVKSYKGKSKDSEMRAEIIKKCVNSHNDLVDALKEFRQIFTCDKLNLSPAALALYRIKAEQALEKAGVTL